MARIGAICRIGSSTENALHLQDHLRQHHPGLRRLGSTARARPQAGHPQPPDISSAVDAESGSVAGRWVLEKKRPTT